MEALNNILRALGSILSYLANFILPQSLKNNGPFPDIDGKPKPTVAVIGSGFSGLCAAIQVKKNFGIKPQIFEASSQIGGTWWHNSYPGCACDIPSHLYSFSFELNPGWSHTYSPQGEILEYIMGVANKYGIYEHTLLNTEVIRATWLDDKKKWKLDYKNKNSSDVKTSYYDIVFGALGPLRVVNIPEEYKSFEGPIVHTAFWDHKIDFKNKRVAVIGSGASAVQAIPELQKVAAKIYSYQRSPVWIVDRGQWKYPGWMRTLFYWCPLLMHIQRTCIYFFNELVFPIVFKDANARITKFANRVVARDMRKRLEAKGRMDLAKTLIPTYPVGCKRICRSETYLEALAEKNVVVKKGTIKEVKGHSIIHEDGSIQEVDILVLATGFNVKGFLGNLEIRGKNNTNLSDEWEKNYPGTLRSINMHGFPNFFLILGPNTGLGHNSALAMIEILIEYAMNSMKYMMDNNLVALEPRKEAQDAFVAKMRREIKNTTWTGGCTSWYKDEKGELYVLWPGTISYFWYHMLIRKTQFVEDFFHYTRN